MDRDSILMIPYLSKELNLIGYPNLPYTLKKAAKAKSKAKFNEESLEVVFNSRTLLDELIPICFELVNKVKTMTEDDNGFDKLNFENSKLERQLKLNKLEYEKVLTDLENEKQKNRQLQEKIDSLERKLRDYEVEQRNISRRNHSNENALKHNLKKKELDLFELHKIIWKQNNMANVNYFPENFKLVQLNQQDFSKLWSTVKYSDPITREDALKQAVVTLQKNNKSLMEDNFFLKAFFLTILQEIHEVLKVMVDKLQFPASILIDFKVKEIFQDIEIFNVCEYRNIVQKHFKIIKRVCELFTESSFTVSEDLFVCWSNIIKSLQFCNIND